MFDGSPEIDAGNPMPWTPEGGDTHMSIPDFLRPRQDREPVRAHFGREALPSPAAQSHDDEPSSGPPEEEVHPEPVEQRLRDSFQQGYEKGFEEAMEKRRAQDAQKALLDRFNELDAFLAALRREAGPLVLDIALECAERILGHEIQNDRRWLETQVTACLEQPIKNGAATIRLNPADLEPILQRDDPPAWAREENPVYTIVPDPELIRGDCIVDTSKGRVDGRLENQLANLRLAIEDLVVKGLASPPEQD